MPLVGHDIPSVTAEGMVETSDNSFGIVELFEDRIVVNGYGRLTERILPIRYLLYINYINMKNTALKLIFAIFALCFASSQAMCQESYNFDHGPYIQGLTTTEATIFFTTSAKGFSWVEARKKGVVDSHNFVTVNAGLIEAFNTSNAIRIDGLMPAVEYEYRLVSKEIKDFQPYKVTYGDSIASPWYSFSTIDPATREFSFMAVSDIHDDPAKYRKLMSHMPMDSVRMVFLVGDIINYFHKPEQPYKSFIDPSVEVFATEKPFVVVRGNHETRGNMAREYHKYVYLPGGCFYGLYRIGDTAIIMLDSGEDKLDSHPVYAGIVSFDDYRQKQADWLGAVVKTKEFTSARHRIVMVHIPPIDRNDSDEHRAGETDHGTQQIYDLFVPILNKEKINLMISGHTHRQIFIPKQKGVYNFPIVINDNKSASYVHVSPAGVRLKTLNINGEVTFESTF